MKFNYNIFKQALCAILIVQGMTMYSQVHVENAENVVVYDENNVQFFGKNTIKSESGVIEFSENVKSKLTKKEHYNRTSSFVKHKMGSSKVLFARKNPIRKGRLVVAKEEKINLPLTQLQVIAKHTKQQCYVATKSAEVTSALNLFENQNCLCSLYSKPFINNSLNKNIEVQDEQKNKISNDFIEENKPYLYLHENAIEENKFIPINKNLKDFNTLLTIHGERGPPFFL